MEYKFEDENHEPLEVIIRLHEFMKFDMRGPELTSGEWYGSVQSHLVYAYMWLSNEIYYGGMSNYYEYGEDGTQFKFILRALDILLENHSGAFDEDDLAHLSKCKQGLIDNMSVNVFEKRIEHGEKLTREEKKLLTQLRKSAIDMEEVLFDSSSRYASYPAFALNYCLKNPVLFDRKGSRIEVPGGGSLRKFFEAEGLWDQGSYENEIPKYEAISSGPGDGPAGKSVHDRAEEPLVELVDFSSQESLGKCPVCAGRVFEYGDAYVCEKSVGPESTCIFRIDKILLQQPIDSIQIKKLLAEGKTDLLDGFVSSLGKKYSAYLVVSEGQVIFFNHEMINPDPVDFSLQESLGNCPRCAARVFEQSDAYVCEKSVGPEKTCDFRAGKSILQQPIDAVQMKKLLADGRTDLLNEFVSNRTRQKFSAFLVLNEGKASFEFFTPPIQEKEKVAGKKVA